MESELATEISSQNCQTRFAGLILSQNANLWQDPVRARDYLAAWIRDRLELAEPEVCRHRQAFFELPLTVATDFAERLISICGGSLLAGIRFRNLDRQFPFLEVLADMPLNQLLLQWQEVRSCLLESFAVFSPLGMTVRASAAEGLSMTQDMPTIEIWNLYLSGKTGPCLADPSFELIRPARILEQAHISDAYCLWGIQHPELANLVQPESRADLENALDAGLYFHYYAGGELVGLIAGQASAYWDCSGVCVIEELIFPHWQQRGHGKRMQSLFRQQIAADYACLWGTIHPANQPSLKTALGCGRAITEREVFLRF